MPSFTFKGFETGTAVALSAQQLGNSASGTVSTWDETGGGNLADLSIQILDQSSLVAPAVMFFRAVPGQGFQMSTAPAGTPYEPWRHEITYIWRVRNAPLVFERAPHLNIPEEWKNANIYYGPEAAIVFDGPGTYHIDLVAVDRYGNLGEASQENIIIASADTAFPGGATIVVSDNSDFTGAPGGATPINLGTGTWATVQAAIDARGGNNTRVLMKAGVDFRGLMVPGNQFGFGAMFNAEMAVGAFGAGAKPILPLGKQAANGDAALFGVPREGNESAKFYNIDMRGGWQADRERGYQGASPIWRNTRTDLLFHRCRLSGHNTLSTQNFPGDCYLAWSDGEVTNWQNFALFAFPNNGGSKRFAIIGSDLHQHPDARQGKDKSGHHNEHGPLRVEENENLYLHVVDMFSRNGWSTGSGGTADQACIRVNSNGAPNAKTIADRCAFEGGYQCVKIAGQNILDSTPDMPGNHVFDKILTIGTPETQWHFDCNFGGTTVRNAYGFEPNVPKYSQGLEQGLYTFDSDDTVIPSNHDTPIAIYSSTFVSLLSTTNQRIGNSSVQANVPGVFEGGDFTYFTDENNIEYMPNQDTPNTTVALDLSTPLAGGYQGVSAVTPRFKGTGESIDEVSATGNGSDTLTLPYSALPDANGGATNQSYWQARQAAGSTMHQVLAAGYTFLYSDLGELDVSYNASNVTIRRLDGQVFDNGVNVTLKLDQSDTLPALNPIHDTTSFTVPAVTLTETVNASGAFIAPDVYIAADPFLTLGSRAASGLPGAPAGTPQKGAF